MKQKGIIALSIPFIFLLFIALVIFILISSGIIKNPLKSLTLPLKNKEATVSLKTQYQNPFDKSSQYVNPFSAYKNPFDTLK